MPGWEGGCGVCGFGVIVIGRYMLFSMWDDCSNDVVSDFRLIYNVFKLVVCLFYF